MTRGMLPVLFFVVFQVCGSSLGTPSPSSSASASASAEDRDLAADDRKKEPPSDLQLLVPMVMVDEGSPSQGRSGTNQRSDSSSSEEDERLGSSLNKLVQLLSGLQPRHTAPIAPLTPRPRVLPSRPAILNDDEECPVCFVLHTIQAMEEHLEKRNNVGQLNNRAGKLNQVVQLKNEEAPAITFFWDQMNERWDQKSKLRDQKSQRSDQKSWDFKHLDQLGSDEKVKLLNKMAKLSDRNDRWDQKSKLWDQRKQRFDQKIKFLNQKNQRWDQNDHRWNRNSKLWDEKSKLLDQKGQRFEQKLKLLNERLNQNNHRWNQKSKRWDQKNERLDQKAKLLEQEGQRWNKADERLDQKKQAGRDASQGCTLCFFEFGSMNRRAGDAPDAGPAPELAAPQGNPQSEKTH